jgi:TRAP-type C4-dicarboxylate transport system permease large subunit
MNTAYNKAIVAVLVPLVILANQKWGLALPVDEATLGALVAAITGAFVYFTPNKEKTA